MLKNTRFQAKRSPADILPSVRWSSAIQADVLHLGKLDGAPCLRTHQADGTNQCRFTKGEGLAMPIGTEDADLEAIMGTMRVDKYQGRGSVKEPRKEPEAGVWLAPVIKKAGEIIDSREGDERQS